MPTRDRHRFVGQAIRYFLRQNYPKKELVIVDDGDQEISALVPDNDQIRYIRVEGIRSLGEKRNLACESSRGDLIAHWDDDDWMSVDRLERQASILISSGADVCGAKNLLHYRVNYGEAWLYRSDGNGTAWIAGGTLLYKRSLWEAYPFPNIKVGEDSSFIARIPDDRKLQMSDYSFYVALIHDHNTGAKVLSDPHWQRRPFDEVSRLLRLDRDFYAALRRGSNGSGWSGNGNRTHHWIGRNGYPRVTVSIPYYRCKPYIRSAVESILNQTYTNLRLVVVNDGDPEPPWDQLIDIDDPRLIRFDLPTNHGRYFADAVVLNATQDPYFLIQDADDWSEPNRINILLAGLRRENADAALSSLYRHEVTNPEGGYNRVETYPNLKRKLTPRLHHRASHVGLYKTSTLKKIGGYYGGYRIGYDTLLISLLLMTGDITYIDQPLYTRRIRPGSLTTSQTTGMKSYQRNQTHQHLQSIYQIAFKSYRRYLSGHMKNKHLRNDIRLICQGLIPQEDKITLMAESTRLSEVMNTEVLEMERL
jgi:glycosyltransferase involved in cell wall biosynthesis